MKTRNQIKDELAAIARECAADEPDIAVTLLSLCGAIASRDDGKFAAFAREHAQQWLDKNASQRN